MEIPTYKVFNEQLVHCRSTWMDVLMSRDVNREAYLPGIRRFEIVFFEKLRSVDPDSFISQKLGYSARLSSYHTSKTLFVIIRDILQMKGKKLAAVSE